MRQIIFRGRRLTDNKWVYGTYHHIKGESKFDNFHHQLLGCKSIPTIVNFNEYSILVPKLPTHIGYDASDTYIEYRVKPESIGQFTGIKDFNNKDVYEGDFIKIYWNNEDETTELISYDDVFGYWKYGNNPICELVGKFKYVIINNDK